MKHLWSFPFCSKNAFNFSQVYEASQRCFRQGRFTLHVKEP